MTIGATTCDELSLSSDAFPGGTVLNALFDRTLMQLSDRGGASGMIGQRWADLCAAELAAWPGSERPIPRNGDARFAVERIVRLDDSPEIAAAASRRKLQNPDFLLAGIRDGRPLLQAVDAKFSVETAKSSQVSADVVSELLQLGPMISDLLSDADRSLSVIDGIFLCPDFSLTHLMLEHRRGLRKVTVGRDAVQLVPVAADAFMSPLEGASLLPLLAGCDGHAALLDGHLLVALYYFRLARACVCCWLDETGPLLTFQDPRIVDLDRVEQVACQLADVSTSGWDVVERWNDQAEIVRRQRLAVDHVTSLPLTGRELRARIEGAATAAGVTPPSVNKVRRRAGFWLRARLRDEFGPLHPPVASFPDVLARLGARSRALLPALKQETEDIILDLVSTPSEPSGS